MARSIVAGALPIIADVGRRRAMPRRRGKGEGNIGRREEDGLGYGRIDQGRDSTGKRRSRTVCSRTRDGAAAMLQSLLEAQGRGRPAVADGAPIGSFLAERLEKSVASAVRPRTFESYAQVVRVLCWPFTPSGLIFWQSLRKSARVLLWME